MSDEQRLKVELGGVVDALEWAENRGFSQACDWLQTLGFSDAANALVNEWARRNPPILLEPLK